MIGWIRFYLIAYPLARVKYWFRESLPWALAWLLPRKIALFAFVRVYSVLGECGSDYVNAYTLWEQGRGR